MAVVDHRSGDRAAQFLVRLQGGAGKPVPFAQRSPVEELVFAFLLWNAPRAKAEAALSRLKGCSADLNDLRVHLAQDVVEVLGPRYPRVHHRSRILLEALRHVFERENELALDRLRELGARQIRAYLTGLNGVNDFVADHVLLHAFDARVIPVDDRLKDALVEADIVDAGVELRDLTRALSRGVCAEDARLTHLRLLAWLDRRSLTGETTGRRRTGRPLRRQAQR